MNSVMLCGWVNYGDHWVGYEFCGWFDWELDCGELMDWCMFEMRNYLRAKFGEWSKEVEEFELEIR